MDTIMLFGFEFNVGDVATWFTGILTFILLGITLYQINHEIQDRKKKEKNDQASKISSWIKVEEYDDAMNSHLWIAVNNISDQPIYQTIISIKPILENGKPLGTPINPYVSCLGIIPPGQYYVKQTNIQIARRAGVEIGFRDATGLNWVRMTDGALKNIDRNVEDYFNVSLPVTWEKIYDKIPQQFTTSLG